MDREPEELQFLGVVGVFAESTKLVAAHRRLFSKISTTLILPLSLLFLAHVHISHLLFSKIDRNETALEQAPPNSQSESRLLSVLSSEWALFFLFKAVYLLFLLVFALLSTSAVVYSVASIFTAKDLSFSKVFFTVVPKVWKRLMITFLFAFLIYLCYNLVSAFLFVSVFLLLPGGAAAVILGFLFLAYLAGLVWISVVWHLASVVSVLEDACGIAAMKKSRDLIKGKSWMAVGIFLLLNIGFVMIEFAFRGLVVRGSGFGSRSLFGLIMLGLLVIVILLGLVVQTVVYFVCKSYHHESIDKSTLADHLEVYLGEYVPLKGRDVQMEQFQA